MRIPSQVTIRTAGYEMLLSRLHTYTGNLAAIISCKANRRPGLVYQNGCLVTTKSCHWYT